MPVETLRTKVFIERLLARLFQAPTTPWVLKGGYSFELRYRPRARTTRDIDLSMDASTDESPATRIARVRDELQAAAEFDLGDHVVFHIGAARNELQGAPRGGATYPVQASIAGKRCADFLVDIGFGDAMSGGVEELRGDDLLSFAGIPPARVRSISTVQQFAEKIHAYTFEWAGRENSRVKDLVDLVVLIDRADMDLDELRRAIRATFDARDTHPIPPLLREPPPGWRTEFATLSREVGDNSADLAAAFAKLASKWAELWP